MLPAPLHGGFAMEGYWVWCGSVIRGDDGNYHLFASRWPKTQPMHPGWLLQSEVVRAVSAVPEGPYEFAGVVLPARGPEYWDGRMTHNPRIMKQGNTYILYYIGSTHPFADIGAGEILTPEDPRVIVARSNKRIGIATASCVTGPWKRFDAPVLPTRPGHFDSFLTSNPAPCFQKDGSAVLIYKARAYKEPPYTGLLHGKMTLGAARSDNWAGPYRVMTETSLFPDGVEVEDPFIWQEEGVFQMIAKDMHGNVCGEKYGGIHAWSKDGVKWNLIHGELAYSRRVLWSDGTVRLMGNMERPCLLFDEKGRATHAFFAASDGTNGFYDAENTWNMVIPLKVPGS